jgi:hypothetical protein
MVLWAASLLFCMTAWSEGRVEDVLRVLEETPSGRRIVARARQTPGLEIEWGEVSKTDAVLTRHFNTATGQESRIRKVTVYLRRDQKPEELVLDLAHELTHATAAPQWDPYDPELTPADYVWRALEAPGGEVDALVAECELAFELSGRWEGAARRCERYRVSRASDRADRQRVKRDFYRVGRWHAPLLRRLGADKIRFPLLSGDDPELYSSTGQAPYPVALLKEFEDITRAACENSRKRLSSFSSRAPASERGPAGGANVARFLSRRCKQAETGLE